MNNSTLFDTNATYFPTTYSRTLVASAYMTESIPFTIINLIVLTTIVVYHHDFRNDFFFYNANMLFADTICLISVGIYTSLCLFYNTNFNLTIQRLMSVLIDVGWYPKSLFLVYSSYTRFELFRKTVLSKRPCTVYTYIITAITWLIYVAMTVKYWIGQDVVYILDMDIYTWYYDTSITYGYILTLYNTAHNMSVSILLTILNLMTVYFLYKKKPKFDDPTIEQRNAKRRQKEQVLYIQCVLSSGYFVFGAVIFTYITFVNAPIFMYAWLHCMWLSQHAETAIVFLLVNKKLRSHVKKLMKLASGGNNSVFSTAN